MPVEAESFARRIVERLQAAGHVAYFAGGCVRDSLMGRVPKDFDVATSARPEEVLKVFPRGQQVGAAFGVILLVEGRGPQRLQVEVATFRADGTYTDGRHPDSVRFTTAQEDAQRRDFTCNGLFLDPVARGGAGELHDFVGGRADIEGKILRAIGDPAARFGEDHLRMLRAVRFAAKLGFKIEATTWNSIQKNASAIQTISRERIGAEFRLILGHPSRVTSMQLLQNSGLLACIWPPELFLHREIERHWLRLERLPMTASFSAALVAVYRPIAFVESPDQKLMAAAWISLEEATRQLREHLVLSNDESVDFLWLADQLAARGLFKHRYDLLPISKLKRLMADRRWPDLFMLHRTQAASLNDTTAEDAAMNRCLDEGVAPEPFVNGETLIALGAVPGPKFKGWLEALYDRQLELEFKTREEAVAAARGLVGGSGD